jgi:hypothetical protein
VSTFALASCIAVIVIGGLVAVCFIRPRTDSDLDERS